MTTTLEKMDEFEQLLEESFAKSNSVADIVEGTIIKKEQDGYLVSVKGAKMEAYLPSKELSSDIEEMEIGQLAEFAIRLPQNVNALSFQLVKSVHEYCPLKICSLAACRLREKFFRRRF